MKRILSLLSMLLVCGSAFSQQSPSNTAVFDPLEQNTNTPRVSAESKLLLDAYLDSVNASNVPQNDLDVFEFDKVILDALFAEMVTEPRVAQARLDLSDIQFEKVRGILTAVQAQSAELSSQKFESICSELARNSANSAVGSTEEVRDIAQSVEISFSDEAQALVLNYQQAIAELFDTLGTANSEVFQEYLSKKRADIGSLRVLELPEILVALDIDKDTLIQNCN